MRRSDRLFFAPPPVHEDMLAEPSLGERLERQDHPPAEETSDREPHAEADGIGESARRWYTNVAMLTLEWELPMAERDDEHPGLDRARDDDGRRPR